MIITIFSRLGRVSGIARISGSFGGLGSISILRQPVITGSHYEGQTLTVDDGVWSTTPSVVTYQWLRDGSPIGGATSSTYLLTSADVVAEIECEVTADGASATSTPSGPWQPTDLAGLEIFVHAPWETQYSDGAAMPRITDWANPARLWHMPKANVEPLYKSNAGDGLATIDTPATLRYVDIVTDPPNFTRAFTAYTVAKQSSANAYLWEGTTALGPAIISGFGLGSIYWYGNPGDRYAIQSLPGDANFHVAGHIHAAGSVTGRLDGVTAYNTVKTTIDYSAATIRRLLTASSQSQLWRGQVRSIVLVGSALGTTDRNALESWLAAPRSKRADPLTVTTPAPWQTFQRNIGSGTGAITISATVGEAWRLSGATARARFNGGAWTALTVGAGGAVTGAITGVSPARGTLEVELTVGPLVYTAQVLKVAVGDVYVVAGQSNAMGQANNKQTSVGALGTAVLTGAYQWVGPASDPVSSSAGIVDTVADNNGAENGSPWPILGDLLNTRDAVPVAFIPCAKGSTLYANWVPGVDHFDRSTLYGQMAYRAQVSGARAVLWYLGESDALGSTSAATVQGHLTTIANAIDADLGIPSYWARIHSWTSGPSTVNVNTGITNGVAGSAGSAGPDQSAISLGNIHYLTTAELTQLATAWRDALP